ncbi:MAG TPA: glycosyltransferase [Candidatus Saccharimonadaceae bacterium]|nr:glycosyltransferase [Candidatus Saccharimonadaceae bacterium]
MSARVSVVFAVYNAAWCIERALDSLLGQSRPPDEVLVCDDGSTDGTPELVERHYGSFARVLRLPHHNAAVTRIVGLDQVAGDWIAFMDGDDWWKPAKLERQLAYLERHPDVRWCGTDGEFVSEHEVIRPSWLSDYFDPVVEVRGDLLPLLTERCFPLLSSMLVSRDAYREVGGLDPSLTRAYDYDLWMRLAARYPGAILPEPLIYYYSHPGSLSRNFEPRYVDDLVVMRRAAAGAYSQRRDVRRIGATRAAALEFDLAILAFRSGRAREARARMRRAARSGPWSRRLVAAAGALLPASALPRLMRSPLLKDAVRRNRRQAGRLPSGGAP